MDKILAIDSSTEACSVALKTEHGVFSQFELAPRRHAELLLPMVEQVLQQANLNLKDIHAIACCVGPGAFTGLRIAISMAQALAYAAGKPCIGVSSLQIMAAESFARNQTECCLAAIDARMSEVYFGSYRRDTDGLPVSNQPEKVLAPTDIELTESLVAPVKPQQVDSTSCSIVGTGWAAYDFRQSLESITTLKCDILYPKAEFMIGLAAKAINNNQLLSAPELLPKYIRNNVAKKKSQLK